MDPEWIPWTQSGAVSSPWICGDRYVEQLEQQFSSPSGLPAAVAVSNGKAALELALLALGIGPGDEIIVPALGVPAAEQVVAASGARLVPADVNANTWCIDPESVAQVVTHRTRAIIAVHLRGNMADLATLREVARKTGTTLVDDAAEGVVPSDQEYPAVRPRERVSTHSLRAISTDAPGQGGIVMTGDQELYGRLRSMRDQRAVGDQRRQYCTARPQLRLTNPQAAIACAEAERLHERRDERARVQRSYRQLLQNVDGFEQLVPTSINTLLWACVGRMATDADDPDGLEARRDEIVERMRLRGIEIRRGFYPPCSSLTHCGEFPNARRIAAGAICLPMYAELADATIERICYALRRSLRETIGRGAMS
jgi:perosamine synthetase